MFLKLPVFNIKDERIFIMVNVNTIVVVEPHENMPRTVLHVFENTICVDEPFNIVEEMIKDYGVVNVPTLD